MHRSRRSFKETLNAAIRESLRPRTAKTVRTPFVIKARPMGLKAGIDPTSFNKLADDLEMETRLAKSRPAKRR
jgi:hypothetical protein